MLKKLLLVLPLKYYFQLNNKYGNNGVGMLKRLILKL